MGGVSFKKLIDPLGLFTKDEAKPAATAAVSTAAADDVAADAKKAQAARAALYETDGGAGGATLDPNQVEKRQTLFGN